MRDYMLYLRDIDAPPVTVPSYSVEAYFAIGEEQAERMHVRRCINPELPDASHIYFQMFSLPENLYEYKEKEDLMNIWKIKKENAEEVVRFLGIDKSEYPYKQALNLIEGDYFWIITWDD